MSDTRKPAVPMSEAQKWGREPVRAEAPQPDSPPAEPFWSEGAKLTRGPDVEYCIEVSDAPCDRCGYNGPGYYQRETHPCVGEPAPTAEPSAEGCPHGWPPNYPDCCDPTPSAPIEIEPTAEPPKPPRKTATYNTLPHGEPLTVEYDPDAPCRLCGKPVIEASMGGTDVCPWCDSGKPRIEERLDRMIAVAEAVESESWRKAIERDQILSATGIDIDAKPEPPAPSPELDPLEGAMKEWEAIWQRSAHQDLFEDLLAALRVLKRGHAPRSKAPWEGWCKCGERLPCPILAEAARALRGEK